MEAKSFVFSMLEGEAMVRLVERMKGFAGAVTLGLQCYLWLVETLEVALRNPGVWWTSSNRSRRDQRC